MKASRKEMVIKFSSVQSCPTVCDPVGCSMPGLPELPVGKTVDSSIIKIRNYLFFD